ncbi:MAG: amidohydrolase [Gemmatimonadales bacterium]|nr:MAG: amidohydrolase [Gemmatimonadales bacterium]
MRRVAGRVVGPLTLVLSVVAGACGPEMAENPADLVLVNGKVVTVDDAVPEAQGLAVRDGRVVAVGSSRDMRAWVGAATEVVDLDGRLAVPGLIEGHGHYLGLGRAKMILDLTTTTSFQDIVDMVAVAVAEADPGEWITGRGWHQEKWTSTPEANVDGVPYHDALSAVSPDNPVSLTHASGHASFVNARALEEAGISASTQDPDGGTIVRGPEGRATGLLRETAQGLVGRAMSRAQSGRTDEEVEAEFRRQVQLAGEEALANGITSFHDAGVGFGTVDGFRRLADEGALPVRLYVMVRASNEQLREHLADYRMEGYGGGFLTVRSIKRSIDGALGSHGAWLLEPYDDLPTSTGLNTDPVDGLNETARIALEAGYQVNIHAIGDRGNREVLDLYQRTWDAAGVDGSGMRWRIEHAQHLHPDDIGRFSEMGVIAAMQGVHATSDGPWVEEKLGEWRAETGAYMWRDLWDSGVVIANGTDVPVEAIDPLASYYSTVSRMTSTGEPFYPGQALTRLEALRSYTLNNAYAAFQEEELGSLAPGKLADITVLDRDILTVPVDEISRTEVVMTIVDGVIRYRAQED